MNLLKRRYLLGLIGFAILLLALDRAYVTPILLYQHIDDHGYRSKLSVSPESFARQMEFLKTHRYRVLSLSDYVHLLRDKKRPPRKSVIITFDDGYDDNFSKAYPVLRKMDFPATVFVQTGEVGAPGYLMPEDLAIMSDNGVEIQSHTVTHPFLPDVEPAAVEKELADSKAALEGITEKPVSLFAYPGGGYTPEIARLAEKAGYEAAVTTNRRGRGPLDLFALRRIRVTRTADNLFVFWLQTSGFFNRIEEWRRGDEHKEQNV